MAKLHFLSNVFIVLIVCIVLTEARNRPPLMGEERPRNKAAECVFGNQIRELGSSWIPDLGAPFGVLYCMKCECVPVQRKRRIVTRVQCRNINNECPKPSCENSVKLPGRCCATCPGDTTSYNPNMIQDIVPQSTSEEEEKGFKHFAALLTAKSSLVFKNDPAISAVAHANRNQIVASGRFNFHKRNLYYSFFVSEKSARPRAVQFVDSEGNILVEFMLSRPGGLVNSVYQNATRKICGVWRRLPKMYRKLLRNDKLYVVLVWGVKDHTEFTISGQIVKHNALSKESFSSLLESAPRSDQMMMAGAGGTAVVSISTMLGPSIHIAAFFNGLFTSSEIANVPINITLSLDEKKVILRSIVKVEKPSSELNLVEATAVVSNADLRLLTRGRLMLTVSSVSLPSLLKLSGNVITKATCELFQASLSSQSESLNPYGTSGLAWLYLTNEGSLVYNIQVDNLRSEQTPAAITFVDFGTKRKTELEDLTPYFQNGWANGTMDKLSAKVLEPLYSGDLAVNVATQNISSLIRGRLIAKPVGDARDSPSPILLKRQNYSLPPSTVGLAWLNVDNDCHLHYDVSLTGLGSRDRRMELHLELLPMLAPGAPVIDKHLDSFQGNQVEGSPIDVLTREELNRMDTGVAFLKVKDKESKMTLLLATITKLKVPQTCRPPYTDNTIPTLLFDNTENTQSGDCFSEGKFYQDEAQWTSMSDPCTMCFCQNGKEKCDTMTCPEPDCPLGERIKLPGECCPVCPVKNNYSEVPHKCMFNGKSYSRGSKFHPFLIPNGFDTCTECVCDPLFLEIKCSRQTNERNCCKSCSKHDSQNANIAADEVPLVLPSVQIVAHKEDPEKNPEQIINNGGCKNLKHPERPYENGAEYHPFIDMLGEYKCVTCKCNNGNQTCKRQHCDRHACEKMFRMRRNRTLSSSENCCSLKECRKFRHRRNHRMTNTLS